MLEGPCDLGRLGGHRARDRRRLGLTVDGGRHVGAVRVAVVDRLRHGGAGEERAREKKKRPCHGVLLRFSDERSGRPCRSITTPSTKTPRGAEGHARRRMSSQREGPARQRAVLVVARGGADVVEELGDLELGRGFGFGGEFLDRLARGLQFGFFGRAGDVQADLDRHFRVQRAPRRCGCPGP